MISMKLRQNPYRRANIISLVVVAIIFVSLTALVLSYAYHKQASFEDNVVNDIKAYDTIVVNGEEYETCFIEEVLFDYQMYKETEITLILSDGTKIKFTEGNYTMKNRKGE